MTLNLSMKNMVKIKVSDTFLKKRGNHKMPIQSKNKIALKGGLSNSRSVYRISINIFGK